MPLFQDFKTFALRGNLLDLAIGFTVGAAFSTVARSLVDDLLNAAPTENLWDRLQFVRVVLYKPLAERGE